MFAGAPIQFVAANAGVAAADRAQASTASSSVLVASKRGASVHEDEYHIPNGRDGDLVAGVLQTHGSKPVTRI